MDDINPEKKNTTGVDNEAIIRLAGLAIIAGDYGDITEPQELPDGFSFQAIHTTGSRPWGIVRADASSPPEGGWDKLAESLGDDYLIHQLTIATPHDREKLVNLKKALQRNECPWVNYDNISIFVGGKGNNEVSIVINRGHLSRDATGRLLQWIEGYLMRDDSLKTEE